MIITSKEVYLYPCVFIYIVMLLNAILYYRNNTLYFSNVHIFYENCISNTNINKDNNKWYKYRYGKDLWKDISKYNNKKFCCFIQKMNLFKTNNSFFYHRLYCPNYKSKKISVDGVFPDESYHRLIPKNKYDFKNVITDTYKIQNYIYNYQHPLNCENKKYLIIKGFNSGHGSEIHVITSYLALALSINRIAIFDPYYRSMKAFGKYCKRKKNWLCFLEQLTNCSLPSNVFINTTKYLYSNQTDKYLYVENVQTFRQYIPQQIIGIVKNSPLYNNKLLHYWRIQASTYVFRINKKTDIETNKIIYNSLGNKLNSGCFNIWIRHGDKYKEMVLLKSNDYISSYKIYKLIVGYDVPVYLSTDDPNVTKYFDNIKNIKSFYLKFYRNNDCLYSNIKRGDEMTLNFIADIKSALYCNGFSGTRKSNVVRLIDELRSTVGLSANSIYFENGNIKFSDTSYENDEYW